MVHFRAWAVDGAPRRGRVFIWALLEVLLDSVCRTVKLGRVNAGGVLLRGNEGLRREGRALV